MICFKAASLLGLIVLAGTGCQSQNRTADTPARRTVFFDKSGMDTTVAPGDDFFEYANGGWLKKTNIPNDQNVWAPYIMIGEANQKKAQAILEEAAASHAAKGTALQKIGDFYVSGLDTVTIEKRGYDPLKLQLNQISSLKDYREVLHYIAVDPANGLWGVFFGMGVGADARQSTMNRLHFGQAGLSLPEKEYYTRTDDASKKIRANFLTYVVNLFTLTGIDSVTAKKKADGILAFETMLASSHKAAADLRDPAANYHKTTVDELTKQMPVLDLKTFLATMKLNPDTVLMEQPMYFQALNRELPAVPISVLKDKLTFALINVYAPFLSRDFVKAQFDFYNKTLYGQSVQEIRRKRIAGLVSGALSDLSGQLWVEKYFTADAKVQMLRLVNNLKNAYRNRINTLDWMTPETKRRALVKLDKISVKIGYPSKWKDYSDVEIKRDDYFGNIQRMLVHNTKNQFSKINKPIDKAEWTVTPLAADAYANAYKNEIIFPAGFLQFPIFDKDADDAINYGGIGTTIGHEITHLFDDQGRQHDADGNLRDWWTKADSDKFNAKAQMIVDQYNGYTVLDNLHLNGQLTLGENLADLGGITVAYDAFKHTDQGKSNQKIDGFTPAQRFFLGYAQAWRGKMRPESERNGVQTDTHSPFRYRVNGPLSNVDPFYKAFDVKPGQKMYKPETNRTKVW